MKKLLFIFFILISIFSFSQEKRNCGTNDRLEFYRKSHPESIAKSNDFEQKIQQWIKENANTKTSAITIPVVVHVVYKNNSENISDAQIQSQIDVLNEDFRRLNQDANNTPFDFLPFAADMQIEFCLAKRYLGVPTTGIVRKQTNLPEFPLYSDSIFFTNYGGSSAWNTSRYLNIWVCDIAGSVLGWAQFPGSGNSQTDGIVVDYQKFGTIGTVSQPYHKGRTTTHEVGHWLSLFHVWGDNSCGDDFVSDTPEQEQANYGCQIHPQPSCTNSGDMFMNFMDYSDDACMNIFTQGQKLRVMALLNTSRSGLISSDGCQPFTIPNSDAGISSIINPNSQDVECASPVYPKVVIKNYGIDTLFVATIKYSVDAGAEQFQVWNGALAQNQTDTIQLAGIPASGSSHTFLASTINPNNSTDINTQNDQESVGFSTQYGNKINLKLVTDNYGWETSWILLDDNLNIISQGDSLQSNTLYQKDFCLEDGCYSFIIYDSYGDGFCCDFGNGFYTLKKEIDNTILASSSPFTFSDTAHFCFYALSTNEILEEMLIFPNPTTGILYINYTESAKIKISNTLGKVVFEQNTVQNISIDLSHLPNGIYFLSANTETNFYLQKLIISK
ncbi:MAG: T9SS type A sorting domain-containing protein [Flavobacteriales bacterium]|nr:T9SS type A sorting domain-containing protein [Flavobacteriales bacterium]